MKSRTEEGTSRHAPRAALSIRNPQDFYGGLVLVVFALFALWAAGDLSGMHDHQFGPGTAPRLFAGLLCAAGLVIAATGLVTDGPLVESRAIRSALFGGALIAAFFVFEVLAARVPALESYSMAAASAATDILAFAMARYGLRGPVLITAAVMTFAGSIRSLGLVVTAFITGMLSMAAADEVNWTEALAWTALLSIFCAAVFKYGLALPLPLWPWS